MSGLRWDCCECCKVGVAKSDHVDHGGDIRENDHEIACTICDQPMSASHPEGVTP